MAQRTGVGVYWAFLAAFVAAFGVYAAFFVSRYLFHAGGQLQLPLFDDGMIYVEYAKNLGLTGQLTIGNTGEHTAGFTSYVWLLALSAIAATHVISVEHLTFVIVAINIVLLLGGLALFIRLIPPQQLMQRALMAGLLLSSPSILFWPLRGMEVPLAIVYFGFFTLFTLRSMQGPEGRYPAGLGAVATIAPFVRPELFSISLAGAACLVLFRRYFQSLYVALHACAGFGLYIIANLWLFGQPMSNPYYLKVSGVSTLVRAARALEVAYSQGSKHIVYLAIVGLLLVAALLTEMYRRRAAPSLQLLLSRPVSQRLIVSGVLCMAVLVSWTYIGGDAWEEYPFADRFIAAIIPLILLFLFDFLFNRTTAADDDAVGRHRFTQVAVAAFCIMLLFNVYGAINILGFGAYNDRKFAYLGYLLGKNFPPGTSVLHYWYGQPSFYSSLRGIVSFDGLGIIDPVVARSTPKTKFKPGHDRWKHEHSIGQLQPDLIINMPCPVQHDLSFDCSMVWTEITVTYGYRPYVIPNKIAVFVKPSRVNELGLMVSALENELGTFLEHVQ